MSHKAAAVASSARAEVDDVVGAADGFLVVLDDQNGVPEVAKILESSEQTAVIAMMQADGRLIQNVEDAAQFGPDLRGEADALAFATG